MLSAARPLKSGLAKASSFPAGAGPPFFNVGLRTLAETEWASMGGERVKALLAAAEEAEKEGKAAEAARIFRGSPGKLAEFDRKGNVLVGDVDPFDVAECASAYTPVPGGVGPLTIAMLMVNTIEAAERRLGSTCCA